MSIPTHGGDAARPTLLAREVALFPILRIWSKRHFRARYRRSVLNVMWSVLNPLVLLLTYGVVLTLAFEVEDSRAPYAVSAWAGLAVWVFFSAAVQEGTTSIVDVSDVITKVYFPREVIPLAVIGASLVDLAIGLGLLVLLAVVMGVSLSVTIVAIVPVLVVLVVWTAGVTVLLATVTVFVRDIPHAMGLALRAIFFFTPIMYTIESLPGSLRTLANLNPIGFCVTSIREAVLYGEWPRFGWLALHGLVGAALLAVALVYVRAAEARMADVV